MDGGKKRKCRPAQRMKKAEDRILLKRKKECRMASDGMEEEKQERKE